MFTNSKFILEMVEIFNTFIASLPASLSNMNVHWGHKQITTFYEKHLLNHFFHMVWYFSPPPPTTYPNKNRVKYYIKESNN